MTLFQFFVSGRRGKPHSDAIPAAPLRSPFALIKDIAADYARVESEALDCWDPGAESRPSICQPEYDTAAMTLTQRWEAWAYGIGRPA